jgi:hypothetical protein
MHRARIGSWRRFIVRATVWALVAASGLLASRLAAEEPDLAALARAAADEFHPVTTADIEAARRDLTDQVAELERWLGPGGRKLAGWQRYLHWSDLATALDETGRPNFEALANVYWQLTSNQPGLEDKRFGETAAALRRFINLAAVAAVGDQQRFVATNMSALADDLEAYAAEPRPRLEFDIGRRIELVAGWNGNSRLVTAVREQYVRTNALVTISETFLNELASKPVNRPGVVRDCILGTTIRGTSYTNGRLSVRPMPSDDRALVEISLAGNVSSKTRGFKKPVVVRSTGQTEFRVAKIVELTDPVFRVLGASAEATTRSTIQSVRSQRDGPLSGLISRIGTKKAHESKRRAEAIASDHAEERIRDGFDEEVLESVTELRQRYRDEFRYPLMRRNEYPRELRFHSSSSAVLVDVTQANRSQLAAAGAPPPEPAGHDVSGRFHQTVASNYSAVFLSGATLSETSPTEDPHLDRPLPTWLERALDETEADDDDEPMEDRAQELSADPFKPWTLTFRRVRPLTIGFDSGQLLLIVHMAQFTSGDEQFFNWDLIARYNVRAENGELVFSREGRVEFLPTGFDPAVDQRMPAGQVAVRQNLMKVVNDMNARGEGIPDRIAVPVVTPRGELEHIGELRVTRATSDNGWLSVGWNLP